MRGADRAPADADLVAAARGGDKDAFASLVDRHRPMVWGVVQRLVRNEAVAADAVQDATIGALVGLDRLRSPERFGAWYAGIAVNTARRWLRAPIVSPLAGEHADGAPGPADQAAAADIADRVREAVAALAPGQRAAVLAFYWQGLTHAEAALELGVAPGAVKARLHQARVALNSRLAPLIEPEGKVRPMPAATKDFVEVQIIEVRRSSDRGPHVVVLEELSGERQLPIYVGAPEAVALACSLESVEMPRPMTYQFSANLVTAAAARVREVRVTRLAEGTFYAEVMLDGPGPPAATVDARPSDALNLALVAGAPIRVDAELLADDEATRHAGWREFFTTAPDLAAEVRERQVEQNEATAEYLRTGEWRPRD